MLAIFNSLNAHDFSIFQPILMILVSKFMVPKVLSDKTYVSLGLLSPLRLYIGYVDKANRCITTESKTYDICGGGHFWPIEA